MRSLSLSSGPTTITLGICLVEKEKGRRIILVEEFNYKSMWRYLDSKLEKGEREKKRSQNVSWVKKRVAPASSRHTQKGG